MTTPLNSNTPQEQAAAFSSACPEPFLCDPWLASSALHKAIRRGDAENAERAVLTLIRHRGTGVFRRLLVIAYEDIGIADTDLLVDLTKLCTDARYRRKFGDTTTVARWLVREMAAAPKDRSSDYLIGSAVYRTDWERWRESAGSVDVGGRIEMAISSDRSLGQRATAAWYASGVEAGREHRFGPGNLVRMVAEFIDAGVPEAVGGAVLAAAKATKEPIVVMLLPLLQELAAKIEPTAIRKIEMPPTLNVEGVPTYALDKHSRVGREAIMRFAKENTAVRAALGRHVPEFRHRDATSLAAYYTDAIPIARRLQWHKADELQRLGTDTDLAWAGIPQEGMAELLDVFRDGLDHLNDVRSRLLTAALTTGGVI